VTQPNDWATAPFLNFKSSGYESDCMFLAITTSALATCSTFTFFTITHNYLFFLLFKSFLVIFKTDSANFFLSILSLYTPAPVIGNEAQ